MRAILRTAFGGPEVLVIRDMPEPEPKNGHAVIEVKAFGLNHAELHMRQGKWAEIADVSGIECVGIVKSCPGGEFPVGAKKWDAVLDLVGNSVVLDSLALLRRGGRSCLAGWLGGLDPIPNFNPLLQMASGVYLTFFGSFVFGTPGFPLSDVPLQQIAGDAAAGRLDVKPVRVFRFEEIQEAHHVMEANKAGGKMVVDHDCMP